MNVQPDEQCHTASHDQVNTEKYSINIDTVEHKRNSSNCELQQVYAPKNRVEHNEIPAILCAVVGKF